MILTIAMQRDEDLQPIVTIHAENQVAANYQPIIETDQLDPNSVLGSLEIMLNNSGTIVVNQQPPGLLEDFSMPEDEMVCSPDPGAVCRDGRCAENGFVMFTMRESEMLFTLSPAYIEVRSGDMPGQCLMDQHQVFTTTEDQEELEYTWEEHLRPWERFGSCLVWSDEDYEIEIVLPAGQNLEFIRWRSLSRIEGNDVVRPCECQGSTEPICRINAQLGPQEAFGCVAEIGTRDPDGTCPDCVLAKEYLFQVDGMSGGVNQDYPGSSQWWWDAECDCADLNGLISIPADDLNGMDIDMDACQHRSIRADLCLTESYVFPGLIFGYYTHYGLSVAKSGTGWKLRFLLMVYYSSGSSSGSGYHGMAVYETREFLQSERCDLLTDEPLAYVSTIGPHFFPQADPTKCQGWEDLSVTVTAVNEE